ncbi:MAG: hypothetical protein AAGF01_22030 [Cyanobacteria bacterium P01_G01_bin.38]
MSAVTKRRITLGALALLFLFLFEWVRPRFIDTGAADALASHVSSGALVENVVDFQGYAYGSWRTSDDKGYMILSEDSPHEWNVICDRKQEYLPIDLLNECSVPASIARHLYTLREVGEGENRMGQAG